MPAGNLVDWMLGFQFDGDVDYFEIDPVAYASALGKSGMATYRARLSDIQADLGPRPTADELWPSRHSHERFVLEWNARRLAILDRDIDAIIRTHAAHADQKSVPKGSRSCPPSNNESRFVSIFDLSRHLPVCYQRLSSRLEVSIPR